MEDNSYEYIMKTYATEEKLKKYSECGCVLFVLKDGKFIPLNYPDNITKDWVDDIDVLKPNSSFVDENVINQGYIWFRFDLNNLEHPSKTNY